MGGDGRYAAAVAWRPVSAIAMLLACLCVLPVQGQPFFPLRNEVTSDLIEREP